MCNNMYSIKTISTLFKVLFSMMLKTFFFLICLKSVRRRTFSNRKCRILFFSSTDHLSTWFLRIPCGKTLVSFFVFSWWFVQCSCLIIYQLSPGYIHVSWVFEIKTIFLFLWGGTVAKEDKLSNFFES